MTGASSFVDKPNLFQHALEHKTFGFFGVKQKGWGGWVREASATNEAKRLRRRANV